MTIAVETNDMNRQIRNLSKDAFDLLHDTDPATRKGILLLIAHVAGCSQKRVKKVIVAMSQIDRKYGAKR